jgi:integrase
MATRTFGMSDTSKIPQEITNTLHDPSDRVLSDLFDPTKATPIAEPEKRRKGRPGGTTAKLLAPSVKLTLEDFYFLRAVINGLKAPEAFERYLGHLHCDLHGNIEIPHGNALLARARKTIKDIVEQVRTRPTGNLDDLTQKLQEPLPEITASEKEQCDVSMSFEEWASTIHPDMYLENELPARYQDYLASNDEETQASEQVLLRTHSLQAKVRALNSLQTELASRPTAEQKTTVWLESSLCKALLSEEVSTLRGLIFLISAGGKNWYRPVPGLGKGRAKRVEQWLDFHAETLPRIDRTMPLWTRQRPRSGTSKPPIIIDENGLQSPALLSSRRLAIVPLELLAVPANLDGTHGAFRSTNPNQYGASNDLQAIVRYLSSYTTAGKHRAFESYRREIERFYLWCILQKKIALSNVTLGEAQAYQIFLKNISHTWIYRNPIERYSPLWRPFRGQLTAKNQNYALGILKRFFRQLVESGYLTSSAFSSLQKTAEVSTGFSIDTSRAFNNDDLERIRQALDTLPGLESPDPLKAAKARRVKLMMEIALTTSMRRSEICSASLKNLRFIEAKGKRDPAPVIDIVGKGKKARIVPLTAHLLELIKQHHEDFRLLRGDNPALLVDLELSQPLLLNLEPAVDQKGQGGTPRAAISGGGLYQLFKRFIRQIEKQHGPTRLGKATPHWSRHTFAHAVLNANFAGKGLPLAQRLLGHSSLATTGQYVEQDGTDLVLAASAAKTI